MPTQNQVQQWLQTAMLAAGTAALTTTSVAMIYLASCAFQGKSFMAQMAGKESVPEGSPLDNIVSLAKQVQGKGQPLEDSTVYKLNRAANAVLTLADQINGKAVPPPGSLVDESRSLLGSLNSAAAQVSGGIVVVPADRLKAFSCFCTSVKQKYNDNGDRSGIDKYLYDGKTEDVMSEMFAITSKYARDDGAFWAPERLARGLAGDCDTIRGFGSAPNFEGFTFSKENCTFLKNFYEKINLFDQTARCTSSVDEQPLLAQTVKKVNDTVDQFSTLVNQATGKEQPPEDSTLGRVNGVMDNFSSMLGQISGQYVHLVEDELSVITDSIYSIPVYHNRFLDAKQKEKLCNNLFRLETYPTMDRITYIANYLNDQVKSGKEIFIPASIKIHLVGAAKNFMENNPIKRNDNGWEESGRPFSMRGYTDRVKRLYGLVFRMSVTMKPTEEGQQPNLTQLASQINGATETVKSGTVYGTVFTSLFYILRIFGVV